ncbi:MAG: LLM class flavin-dependent oxidoreductase [Hyphomonas sp.]|nr:LLM class flavin-dependent oxidoreductase [Hyphomonas sp.]
MIEVVGLVSPYRSSEISREAAKFDASFVPEMAKAYEAAGYDRVLIGQNARSADSLVVGSWVTASTERLKLMIAHRPGFIAPTMAARALASIDALSGGRVGVHIITAFSDIETRCDGDYLTKEQRYHRSYEYVKIIRQMWASKEPFDHEGDWYKFDQAFSEVHPAAGSIPVFWGGASELGVRYGAELADVYALGPGSVSQVGDLIGRVKAEAAKHGRSPRFSMSMRLVIADSDDLAWQRAEEMLKAVEEKQAAMGLLGRDLGKAADDAARKAAQADAAGTDPCLWTGLTQATQGRLQVMCLVGSPDTLVDALQKYNEVGVDNFLITGFDWLDDTARIGSDIIPALRKRCDG